MKKQILARTDYQTDNHPSTKPGNEQPLAISVGEAAKLAGVSRSTLYEEMAAERLAWVKIGKRRVILIAHLHAWLDAAVVTGKASHVSDA